MDDGEDRVAQCSVPLRSEGYTILHSKGRVVARGPIGSILRRLLCHLCVQSLVGCKD